MSETSLAVTREIRFAPLEITGTSVRVRWTVSPPSPLHARTECFLDSGTALDPRARPPRLW